nr:MAG TPA: hypothetical protein [Caudoviricetes sp.]
MAKQKNKPSKEEILEEENKQEETSEETTEEAVASEDTTTDTEEATAEDTEQPTEDTSATTEESKVEENKEDTKPVDKYEESRNIDTETSFDIVKAILLDNNLTIDRKLERISGEANIEYKSIVETFKEFDEATQGGTYVTNVNKYGQLVKSLYDVFRKVLEDEDNYVSMLKTQILMLIFNKYKDTSLLATSVFAYGDAFGGSEEEYQDFVYIITTLAIFQENLESRTIHNIPKLVNFKRADFLHGKRLEEFYLNILQ